MSRAYRNCARVVFVISLFVARTDAAPQRYFYHGDAYDLASEFVQAGGPGFHHTYQGVTETGEKCWLAIEKDTDALRFLPGPTTTDLKFVVKAGRSELMGGIVGNRLSATQSTDDPGSPVPGQFATDLVMTLEKNASGELTEIRITKTHLADLSVTQLGDFHCFPGHAGR